MKPVKGVAVVRHWFAGVAAGPRAGLPLNWPARLSNTRRALSVAEWIRRTAPDDFNRQMFAAYFVDGEDLGDAAVIERHAAGIDIDALRRALSDGTAKTWLAEAELVGSEIGVRATPSWLVNGRLISGLLSSAEFERIAIGLGDN